LNEILTKISNTGIRRRKMEKKSSEKTKPKTKRVRFNLNIPKTERVSLAGDVNACIGHSGILRHERAHHALPRDASRVPPLSLMREGRRTGSWDTRRNPRKEKIMLIYVWNLSPDVSEDNFRQTFEAFGEVSLAIISSTLLKDRDTGQSRTFAFVKMPDQAEARAAIKNLNKKNLYGQQMIVYGSSEN
jgi:hypothetical protein